MITTDETIDTGESKNDSASDMLMTDWFRRVRESQMTHYAVSKYFSKLHLWLGIPTIVLSTLVGTAIFASLDNQDINSYKIIVGLVSMLAAILSSLQTFLSFPDLSEKHQTTAAGYASVRRKLEILRTFPPTSKQELMQAMQEIKKEMDELALSSPVVPEKIHDAVVRDLISKEHNRIFHLPAKKG